MGREAAGKVRAPLVRECIGHLECAAHEVHPIQEDRILVGEVVLALAARTLYDRRWNLEDPEARTLHHLGGNLYRTPAAAREVDPRREVTW